MEHLEVTDRGPQSKWWLDVLAARWVILPVGEGLPDGMVEVREQGGMRLLRNLGAWPEVSLCRAPPTPNEAPLESGGDVSWTITGNQCSAAITDSRPGWLWISVTPVAGWRWTLDGEEVSLVQGPGIVQYLEVPAGTHHLEGRYRPPAVFPATLVSTAALVAVVSLLIAGRRYRSGRDEPPAADPQ
jgi:hypothetical protein